MAEPNVPEKVSLESVVKMASIELYFLYVAHLIISVIFILYVHPLKFDGNWLKPLFHFLSMICFISNVFCVLYIMRLDLKSAKYMIAQRFESAAELDNVAEKMSHFLAPFIALGLAFLLLG